MYDLKRVHDPKRFTISRIDETTFEVKGQRIEEIVRMTDPRYSDGVNRVYDVMEKLGIMRKIKSTLVSEMAAGATSGFFEGEEDRKSPSVMISGRKFSLENLLFRQEER